MKTETELPLFMICFNLNCDETARRAYHEGSTPAPHFAALDDGYFSAHFWASALAAALDAAQAAGFHPAQPFHGLGKIPRNSEQRFALAAFILYAARSNPWFNDWQLARCAFGLFPFQISLVGEFRLTLLGCQPVGTSGCYRTAAGNLVWTRYIFEGTDLLAHGFLPGANQYIGGLARGAARPARADALAEGNAGTNPALLGTARQPAGVLGRAEGGRNALSDRSYRGGISRFRPWFGFFD